MKNVIIIITALLLVSLACGQQVNPAWTAMPTNAQVDSMVRLVKSVNPEIRNPDLVKVGQPIIVPTPAGPMVYLMEDWQLGERQKDCLWTLSRSYLGGELAGKLVPADTVRITDTVKVIETKTVVPWWLIPLILALIVVGLIAVYLITWLSGGRPRWTYRRNDPRRYPPEVPGGLSANLPEAVHQVQEVVNRRLPGRTVRSIEAGGIIAREGAIPETYVRMSASDGTVNSVLLRPPFRAHRATLDNGSAVYLYQSCGNLIGTTGWEFNLPEGWEFQVLETQSLELETALTDRPTTEEHPATAREETVPEVVETPKSTLTITREVTEDSKPSVRHTVTIEGERVDLSGGVTVSTMPDGKSEVRLYPAQSR